ncbi:MAG: phosphoribosylanthranilate isomerase [Porphyromonadaceae bacterium]|nr:phosphoribosylanthranilate isomerase [Porphyromonadaceae bacterium]
MLIKVCGMREPDNIRAVEQCHIDWMGFIFYGKSPRFVARRPAYLPESVRRIGVFVDAEAGEIRSRIEEFGLYGIQLHGHESPEVCRMFRTTGITVIKAFSVRPGEDFKECAAYESCCDYFLFDTPVPGYGGSGKPFDWSLLDRYQGSIPFLLSGGIGPESLPALSALKHPRWAGVDLNSRFEISPARKEAKKVLSFVTAFRSLDKPHH